MNWSDIGNWLKDNSTGLVGLAGSILTGNIPGGVAAVASMVSQATGENDPNKAFEILQMNPEARIELERILKENEKDIRFHQRELIRLQLEDTQAEHKEQQETIRIGDTAEDTYVRRTRPLMARMSFYATITYVMVFELAKVFSTGFSGASMDLAMVMLAPAGVVGTEFSNTLDVLINGFYFIV